MSQTTYGYHLFTNISNFREIEKSTASAITNLGAACLLGFDGNWILTTAQPSEFTAHLL